MLQNFQFLVPSHFSRTAFPAVIAAFLLISIDTGPCLLATVIFSAYFPDAARVFGTLFPANSNQPRQHHQSCFLAGVGCFVIPCPHSFCSSFIGECSHRYERICFLLRVDDQIDCSGRRFEGILESIPHPAIFTSFSGQLAVDLQRLLQKQPGLIRFRVSQLVFGS